jgi:DNA-binding NarL/FixJ family response regulator
MPDVRREAIRQLDDAGLDVGQIADRLGVCTRTVSRAIRAIVWAEDEAA